MRVYVYKLVYPPTLGHPVNLVTHPRISIKKYPRPEHKHLLQCPYPVRGYFYYSIHVSPTAGLLHISSLLRFLPYCFAFRASALYAVPSWLPIRRVGIVRNPVEAYTPVRVWFTSQQVLSANRPFTFTHLLTYFLQIIQQPLLSINLTRQGLVHMPVDRTLSHNHVNVYRVFLPATC